MTGMPNHQDIPVEIPHAIRRLVRESGEVRPRDVMKATGRSRQAVHLHLRRMVASGELQREGAGRGTRYTLPALAQRTFTRDGLDEDHVWRTEIESVIDSAAPSSNAKSIFRYAFTEMLNNAIDHSESEQVIVAVQRGDGRVFFQVQDHGIGVFENVRRSMELLTEIDALHQIAKGKLTTKPERHTGEGVFFTSKAVDLFVMESGHLRWTVDNRRGDQAVGDASGLRGTLVRCEIDLDTSRDLASIFAQYTNERTRAFDRTRATVHLAEHGDRFISRSEAKRIAQGLDRFKEAIIDFTGVNEVGQGFVDELFRVWAREHPEITLRPLNMSPAVEFMVTRGLPSRDDRADT